MLNRSASLAMSTSVLKALPGKLDILKDAHLVFSIYPDNKPKEAQEGIALTIKHTLIIRIKLIL